jgi:YD repeat-containing protein
MNKLGKHSAIICLFSAAAFCPALGDDTVQPVYSYNNQGQITLATYPNGAVMSYTYDSSGNIASVVQVVAPPPPPPDDSNSDPTN